MGLPNSSFGFSSWQREHFLRSMAAFRAFCLSASAFAAWGREQYAGGWPRFAANWKGCSQ